jgi:signal transduction histidine kinase
LKKIDLLDLEGQPLGPILPAQQRKQEMMAHMRALHPQEPFEQHRTMMTFMWGRRWRLPQERGDPPPKVAQRKFWEGSVFGVAIGASSFPGIIAVHANADYILNFRKQIDVQRQIDELGRQPDIEHIGLLDPHGKILAHTDSRLINQTRNDPLLAEANSSPRAMGRVIQHSDGADHYDIVKTINVNGAPLAVLEIGLSLKPMASSWRRSLRSMVFFGGAVLIIGIFGMATIFYLQHSHIQKISSLEAAISRQQRLSELGNMAATVAHEIRNPLNSVSMGLQRLKGEFTPTQDPDHYARFLSLMQEEVRRINSIVEQFLSLARPLKLQAEKISLEEFLGELAVLTGDEAKAANVQVDLKIPPGMAVLEADRNYLKQLLLNLVLNGIQAMPRGGTLTIEARPDKDFLELTVTDQGTGMAPETVKRIFEPYFTTKTNGSGLGLAIARRIIDAHHGTITAESAPEKGSRFRIRLPLKFVEM